MNYYKEGNALLEPKTALVVLGQAKDPKKLNVYITFNLPMTCHGLLSGSLIFIGCTVSLTSV